ncbi:MAG: hypothetical protein WA091_00940 [Minisyncoccales bacterium]
MTSKKKRIVFPVRTILNEETTDLFENLKKVLLDNYKRRSGDNLIAINEMHKIIAKEGRNINKLNKEEAVAKNKFNNLLHQKIDRSAIIECVIILDSEIKNILHQFQIRKLKLESNEIEELEGIEEGINMCLKGKVLPKEFQGKRSFIQNFRKLRHQFAHNSLGVFSFEDKGPDFELFLKNLEGIVIMPSIWTSRGKNKAGVFISYNINSSKFLDIFYKESVIFISMLLEILFPTEKEKIFKFKE